MEIAVKDHLRALLDREGLALLDSPQKLEEELASVCPTGDMEREVLVGALEEGVPQALIKRYDPEFLQETLVLRRAFMTEDARWAVQTWREVLKDRFITPASPPLVGESFDLYCEEDAGTPFKPDPIVPAFSAEVTTREGRFKFRQGLHALLEAHEHKNAARETPPVWFAGMAFTFMIGALGMMLLFPRGPYLVQGLLLVMVGFSAFGLCFAANTDQKEKRQREAERILENLAHSLARNFPQVVDLSRLLVDPAYIENLFQEEGEELSPDPLQARSAPAFASGRSQDHL